MKVKKGIATGVRWTTLPKMWPGSPAEIQIEKPDGSREAERQPDCRQRKRHRKPITATTGRRTSAASFPV
jgi:hypothetical protein